MTENYCKNCNAAPVEINKACFNCGTINLVRKTAMNTCATCKWWVHRRPLNKVCFSSDFGFCHRIENDTDDRVEKQKDWFCSEHSAYQRERDRLEIAKAALAGLLAEHDEEGGSITDYALTAVEFADALLSELEKSDA